MPETTVHRRTCHLCEAMCGVVVNVQDGVIESIKGDDQDPFSQGHICPKAVALKDLHEDPDRLRQPIRKTADGWQPIGWDEAFELVADRLHKIRETHGRNAVGVYLGNPNVHNHGAMMAMLPFLRALGTQNRFSATSNDQLPHMLANLEMFGHQFLFPIPDLDHTDLMICIGANPMASNGSLMSVPNVRGRLKALRERDGQLIVIDPRRTETAALADEFHFIRPGTDAFLLLGMLHTLFEEDRIDAGHTANWCQDLDLVRLAVMPFEPEKVATHTGLSADTIRGLARRLATTPRAFIYSRIGTSTQEFGGLATWLVYLLNILTGKLDRTGGVLFTQPAIDMVSLGSSEKGHIGRRYSRVRQLPEFGGEFPASTMADEMLTPGDGQIRAFVTVAGNPVLSSPNGTRLDTAFEQLDFMVSIDFYLNETTRHADVILPPVGPLERSHYDLIFNAFAIRNVAKYAEPLFTPKPDQRTDWQILLELGHKLAQKRGLGFRGDLGWRAFKRVSPDWLLDLALRTGPYGVTAEKFRSLTQPLVDMLIDVLPARHWLSTLLRTSPLDRRWQDLPKGLSLAMLKENPQGLDLGPLKPSLPERLNTRDRRIQLAPRRYLEDLHRLYEALQEGTQGPDSLLLIGRRHVRSNNSWLHNSQRLVKGKPRCTLMMHPDDANRLGIKDGDTVEAATTVGRIQLPLEITVDIMPGVVSVPHGWGHQREGIRLGTAATHPGVSINDVLRDDQVDTLCGTSVLNGQPVTVTRVAATSAENRSRTGAIAS